MDLTLDADQELLAATARRRLAAGPPPTPAEAAALGWPGLAVPAELGGGGRGLLDVAVLAEELGRALAVSPLLGTAVAGWLPLPGPLRASIAAGDAVVALALHPRGAATPWAGDAAAVLAPRGERVAVVTGAACRRQEALGLEPLYAVDLGSGTAEDTGAEAAAAGDAMAVAGLAYCVGAAEAALALTLAHANAREQFGRPIGSFQAVAHRCVDMRADIDACRYLALQAAWALDHAAGGGDAGAVEVPVAAARWYGAEAMRRVYVNAHQVHGALGFSTEYPLHRYTRSAKAWELAHGDVANQLERVARGIGL